MNQGKTLRTHFTKVPRILLRIKDAAKALAVSERTLHEWVQLGQVPHFKRGGCLLFPVRELRDWAKNLVDKT